MSLNHPLGFSLGSTIRRYGTTWPSALFPHVFPALSLPRLWLCPQCSQGTDPHLPALSAWWLSGLSNSQDDWIHFSDKSPELSSASHSKSISSQGHSLPCLCHIVPSREGQRGSRALEGLLLVKNFPDLRVTYSLAVRKTTVAVSELSRDPRQAQARCWRMAPICPPLSHICSASCFSVLLTTVPLMCSQEGGGS